MAGLHMPVGGITDFIGGFMQAEGKKQDLRDKVDLARQEEWAKVQPQAELDRKKEEYHTQRELEVQKAKKGSDPMAQDLAKFYGYDGQGGAMGQQQPASGAQPVPGQPQQVPQQPQAGDVPPQQAQGAMPSNPDDAPIQPQTPDVNQEQQPQAGGVPPQQAQGGEVQLTPMAAQPPASPPPNEPKPAVPTPDQVGMGSPAATIMQAHDLAKAQNPVQSYIATMPPSAQGYAKALSIRLGITDPQLLEGLMTTYAKAYPGEPQKFEEQVVKPMYESMAREQLKAGPTVQFESLSDDDKEHLQAYHNALSPDKPFNPNEQRLKPLSPAEENKMGGPNGLFQKALNAKTTALSGINTMNSMFKASGDMSFGPMAENIAKIKAGFAQMTDQEASNSVNNWFKAYKDQIITANNNVRNMPSGTRAGSQFLGIEKDAAPAPNMTKKAAQDLMIQYYTNYRLAANVSEALLSGPTDLIREGDRVKFASKYLGANPPVLSDGETPNPRFMEFGDWRKGLAAGIQSTGPTSDTIMQHGLGNMTGNGPKAEEQSPASGGWKYIGVAK